MSSFFASGTRRKTRFYAPLVEQQARSEALFSQQRGRRESGIDPILAIQIPKPTFGHLPAKDPKRVAARRRGSPTEIRISVGGAPGPAPAPARNKKSQTKSSGKGGGPTRLWDTKRNPGDRLSRDDYLCFSRPRELEP
jgi:hypothetical protein